MEQVYLSGAKGMFTGVVFDSDTALAPASVEPISYAIRMNEELQLRGISSAKTQVNVFRQGALRLL